jgi:hypothetical protein
MMESLNIGALFVSAEGVPYSLFIHNCTEKEKIANLIEVSKHSLEFCTVCSESRCALTYGT